MVGRKGRTAARGRQSTREPSTARAPWKCARLASSFWKAPSTPCVDQGPSTEVSGFRGFAECRSSALARQMGMRIRVRGCGATHSKCSSHVMSMGHRACKPNALQFQNF